MNIKSNSKIEADNFLDELNLFGNLTNETLDEVFNRRLAELGISRTKVRDILKISYSTLEGLLAGTQKWLTSQTLLRCPLFYRFPKSG